MEERMSHASWLEYVRKQRRGRGRVYGDEVLAPLKAVWLASNQMCSKRLRAALPLWLGFYETHHGVLDETVRDELLAMSASTIDRLLRPVRARLPKGLSATRAARRLEGQIPIRTRFREADGPGWVEADTVTHRGQSLSGAFVWSLTVADIWSGWTEARAVWNRQSRQIVGRLGDIEAALP